MKIVVKDQPKLFGEYLKQLHQIDRELEELRREGVPIAVKAQEIFAMDSMGMIVDITSGRIEE